jgi:hypothetical protein
MTSPERLAMRQLQGRIRKKLLKRPARPSQSEDKDTDAASASSEIPGTPTVRQSVS